MPTDPAIRDHQAWLGYLQPDGLVVSAAALVDAQVLLDRNAPPLQQRLLPLVDEVLLRAGDDATADELPVKAVRDFSGFVRHFLGWPDEYLYGLAADRPLP